MENHTSTDKIRVVLIDDHTILRNGLKVLLNSQDDITVVGEASNGRDGIEIVHITQPNIVIMDITMDGMNGIEATQTIKKQHPDIRVLILTMHESDAYLFQSLRAGASGYISKEAADTELITAIRTVQNGNFYLTPLAQKIMISDYLQRVHQGEERETFNDLTEREREILKLVADGLTNTQIAERLTISPKTVDTHRSHIMDKLNLHNRAELVKYAIRHGFIDN